MKIQKIILLILCGTIAVLVFWGVVVYEKTIRPHVLTREDLPADVIFVEHTHPNKEQGVDGSGHAKGEMEHYATIEALQNGGPIYGVYGYKIVSLEYEFSESDILSHPVGQDFAGWGLAPEFFGLKHIISYDHFHMGTKENTHQEKRYIIHFMLLRHEEETALGLSCG